MLDWLRMGFRRQARMSRIQRKPNQRILLAGEGLETRLVFDGQLADLVLESAKTRDSQSVEVGYRVETLPVSGLASPVQVTVYRSNNAILDDSDTIIGQTSINETGLTVGSHTATVSISGGLTIDPSRPWIFTKLDSTNLVMESNEANNEGSFRKRTVGVVVHGYQPDGQFPARAREAANLLKQKGYDAAFAFDWAQLSSITGPGFAVQASQGLATEILNATKNVFPANDVIDLHVIAHSRGSIVSALALDSLKSQTTVPALGAGFVQWTLLDPHPLRNDVAVRNESASFGPLGRLVFRSYRLLQTLTNDPALFAPANVDFIETFFQRKESADIRFGEQKFLNPWGVIVNFPGKIAKFYDATGITAGHIELFDTYFQVVGSILPHSPLIPPVIQPVDKPNPIPNSPALENPKATSAGLQYERRLFQTLAVNQRTANSLVNQLQKINNQAIAKQTRSATRSLDQLIQQLGPRRRTLKNPVDQALLLGTLKVIRTALAAGLI